MSAYVIGNLIGRLVLSYALVWIVSWLLLTRLNWRVAFRQANHWSGLTATMTIFLLGLIASQANGAVQ